MKTLRSIVGIHSEIGEETLKLHNVFKFQTSLYGFKIRDGNGGSIRSEWARIG